MRLLIAGGDARYACLAEQAHRAGWDVGTVGLEKAGGDFPRREVEAIGEAEAVLLCNPWRRGLVLPLAEKRFTLGELLGRMRGDAALLLSDAEGAPDALPFRVVDLAQDEAFVRRNALLTAEGAIACAMRGGWGCWRRSARGWPCCFWCSHRCAMRCQTGRCGHFLTRWCRGRSRWTIRRSFC